MTKWTSLKEELLGRKHLNINCSSEDTKQAYRRTTYITVYHALRLHDYSIQACDTYLQRSPNPEVRLGANVNISNTSVAHDLYSHLANIYHGLDMVHSHTHTPMFVHDSHTHRTYMYHRSSAWCTLKSGLNLIQQCRTITINNVVQCLNTVLFNHWLLDTEVDTPSMWTS